MRLSSGILPRLMLICAVAVLSFSCGDDDDDKVDCGKLYNQFVTQATTYFDALMAEDCEEAEKSYQEMKKTLNSGKNCEQLLDALEEEGYDSLEEYIEELDAQHETATADC
jgi:hypothetical protein